MRGRPIVSIVIPNWNGEQWLPGCLRALRRQVYVDFELIIVDNGSWDASLMVVSQECPEAVVIRNARNYGFAHAVNQGIAAARGEYVALLNNDTVAEPTWLYELMRAAADAEPDVGMWASKMLFLSHPYLVNSCGIDINIAGIAWDRGVGEHERHWCQPHEVFGPSGGAALYRKILLEEVGLFDDDFFAYLEDVDLAWRARLRGWRCEFVPEARVLHAHSATGREGSPHKNFLLGRNKWATIIKNYQSPALWVHFPLILIYDLATMPASVLLRRDLSPLRGRWAALHDLPNLLAKRRANLSQARVSFSSLRKQFAPLDPPFKIYARAERIRRIHSNRPVCDE